jgi:hypothetical protein
MKYMVAGMSALIQAVDSASRSRLLTPAFMSTFARLAAQCA